MRLAKSAVLILAASAVPALSQQAMERRRHDLDVLGTVLLPSRPAPRGRINAIDRTWEDWVRRTGELPPDFEAMRSFPELPDPLEGIKTAAEWQRRRAWIREQFEYWVYGRMPPTPGNLRATVTGAHQEDGVTVRDVRLEFGPGLRGSLRVQVMIPPGKGPFPVFLTNHPRTHPWVAPAVRRGYIGCIYFAADPRYGNDDDSDKFIDVYPEYDFSCLGRWAWAGMRAVDYLHTLPEVDKKKIGIAGHSRNGKQALLAAAFDERIGAVAASSGNTGECDPWRYTTDMFANESLQLLQGARPHWFHPRLRFFAGREDKLPVDQHMLLSLVAPRGLLMYAGYAESAGNPFGFEQAYRAARRVYEFAGRGENIWLHLRDGEHPTTAGDVENFVDFFDTIFGRQTHARSETWIHGYSFEGWRKVSGETIDPLAYPARGAGDSLKSVAGARDWEVKKSALRKNLLWALGQEPAGIRLPARKTLTGPSGTSTGWLAVLFNRPAPDLSGQGPLAREGMGLARVPFGDDLEASLFYPLGPDGKPKAGKWPVVVWLHPYTYQNGWSAGAPWVSNTADYILDHRPSFPSLTQRGFAVLAFDQIGFGTRVLDARKFYERYPKWSLMGKMVSDTRAAVDAVSALEAVDPQRIYLLGYALGAKVALMTAALDSRIAGLATVCGVDPLRLDTPDRGVEGIRHYSHLHGLLPRLGFFAGHERRAPFDYDEVLALAAPRPVLVVAPELDRYARIADVRREIEAARHVYRFLGRESRLELESPEDFNRFPKRLQERVFDWLARLSSTTAP
ncbi:MAG: alpha/beta hydrolase family protein [Bryobacteraceae bacterium]